ncbi:DNA-binding protein H-NS [Paraburkholderia sp. BL6669N2]|uniref:H-NS family nucleoid-associated regulatory protein n=1 Tax=Paraburkholderia sp. BL6669N2 TaxID=1938807 RepID=UPI000E28969D|nr:H-NS family nucleoid-associated regulatory protein [Paraburkholderia sp. BL6669N2]REG59299.1 DNA-binding protein H-NS [Paraburkholderia sp. BL6669N2]
MATVESLQAKIAKLKAQAEAIVKKDSSAVIEKIRGMLEKHGLTTADIAAHVGGGKKRGPKPGVKAAVKSSASVAKYRHPKTGATWTGHGRAPAWLANAKNRNKFQIDGVADASAPESKSAAKTGKYVRGAQPAMYRDAKSGATWSGRGRAPAWIAEAKDRSKFLISGRAEATVTTNAGAVSKAKTAGKKTASKSVGASVGAGKGQPKGTQPARYRDPKSGATWSGRGPTPAWLAGAKDRTKFLIDGVSGVADSRTPSKPKAVAKKPSTKAAVAKKAPAKKLVGAKKVGAATNVAATPEAGAA